MIKVRGFCNFRDHNKVMYAKLELFSYLYKIVPIWLYSVLEKKHLLFQWFVKVKLKQVQFHLHNVHVFHWRPFVTMRTDQV